MRRYFTFNCQSVKEKRNTLVLSASVSLRVTPERHEKTGTLETGYKTPLCPGENGLLCNLFSYTEAKVDVTQEIQCVQKFLTQVKYPFSQLYMDGS